MISKNVEIKDIDQKPSSNRIRISVGGTAIAFIAIMTFCVMCSTASIERELSESNDLRRQQLDIAKQQYKLDSLRFEHMKRYEKTK